MTDTVIANTANTNSTSTSSRTRTTTGFPRVRVNLRGRKLGQEPGLLWYYTPAGESENDFSKSFVAETAEEVTKAITALEIAEAQFGTSSVDDDGFNARQCRQLPDSPFNLYNKINGEFVPATQRRVELARLVCKDGTVVTFDVRSAIGTILGLCGKNPEASYVNISAEISASRAKMPTLSELTAAVAATE